MNEARNDPTTVDPDATPLGEALAALVAAGIGSFAIGLVVILNEAGIYSAPSLYGPAGGVSGRVAIAVVVWLVAWAVLHAVWRRRHAGATLAYTLTILFVAAGIILTFPPIWRFFE